MIDIGQYIYDIRNAETIEDAFAILQKYLAMIGLDRTVYSLMTNFRTIGLPAGHAILGNYPNEWMTHYRHNSYEKIDPVRKVLMLTNEPFKWSDIQRYKDIDKPESHLMGEAEDARLHDGIGLGIHCPFGEVIGMGFASSQGGADLNSHTLSLVRMLAQEFHFAFVQFHAHRMRRMPSVLTQKELNVLSWIAKGKSVPEIRDILSVEGSISETTIRFHIRNIYYRLEVSNAPQAVAKGLSMGLLTYADLHPFL